MAAVNQGAYEGLYQWVIEKLPGRDLAANAGRLGLRVQPDGGVIVRLLARDYRVDQKGAAAVDGLPAGLTRLSLAASYALSQALAEASGDFLPLRRLSGLVEGRGSYDREAVSRPLERRFGEDVPALEEAVRRLEGRDEGRDLSGARSFIFYPLPRLPLRLLFHEADEEFPAEFRLLFPVNATEFMDFEALAFLAGALVADLCGPV
ncbi:MAG: DUF3786 domain-containing protein [Candidatus Adiutrix sp.]|jgi:hypothetical protein|nr:DUF3786 domain-containing protein [Candidatus Adiutrix sp.]